MRSYALWSSILVLLLVSCGGSQSVSEAEPPPATVEPEPPPPPPPPAEPNHEHVYYQVFWEELHVMTVYATAGPIRSEEPDNPRDVFSGRSDFMSIVSHYFEREPEMAELIRRAEDLDSFLEILRAEGYEIEQQELEEGY